jgi:hypothetical protein
MPAVRNPHFHHQYGQAENATSATKLSLIEGLKNRTFTMPNVRFDFGLFQDSCRIMMFKPPNLLSSDGCQSCSFADYLMLACIYGVPPNNNNTIYRV